MSRPLRLLTATVLSLAVVLVPTGPALAGPVPLGPNTRLEVGDGTTGATYALSTTSNYWSAVWVRPTTNPGKSVDYDVTLLDGAGAAVGGSALGADLVDVVAIDSNLRTPGAYQAQTRYYAGTGGYQIGFAQPNEILPPMTQAQPVYEMDSPHWPLALRDVYLAAGECLAVTVWGASSYGDVMVLASDPANPVRSRAQAAARVPIHTTTGIQTLRYTAPRGGWYGFAIVDDNVFFYGTLRYQRVAC
ncbi:hypothetical protein Lfu02_60180 [Longispora fulva]|uniref:Uncharacterized protein n=1 Tax=Longispora fulva TaxID=619741 RepID=A0A8J7KKQ2_9ACTN|nr:hypothetical protein [Longispora fulva]MBG6137001.1 hypothetical protein [Longispora fulva]GIG61646.1 hypothetical protein Lfu02_60180 [Longispora fulva]